MSSANKKTNAVPAPLWRRIAAIIYDSFLVLALLLCAGFANLGIQMAIFGEAKLRTMTEQGVSLGGPVFYSFLLLTVFGFFTLCWTKSGQTLGMQAWRVRIISDSGHLISPTQALQRFMVAIPSLCLGFAGLAWSKLDPEQKSWQDKASSSKTVLTNRHS